MPEALFPGAECRFLDRLPWHNATGSMLHCQHDKNRGKIHETYQREGCLTCPEISGDHGHGRVIGGPVSRETTLHVHLPLGRGLPEHMLHFGPPEIALLHEIAFSMRLCGRNWSSLQYDLQYRCVAVLAIECAPAALSILCL